MICFQNLQHIATLFYSYFLKVLTPPEQIWLKLNKTVLRHKSKTRETALKYLCIFKGCKLEAFFFTLWLMQETNDHNYIFPHQSASDLFKMQKMLVWVGTAGKKSTSVWADTMLLCEVSKKMSRYFWNIWKNYAACSVCICIIKLLSTSFAYKCSMVGIRLLLRVGTLRGQN